MANSKRDENNVTSMLGVSSTDSSVTIPVEINPVTGRMKVEVTGGTSPLTTKGDVYTYDTADARLPVGANGQSLVADSAEATGLKWTTPAGGGDVVGPASAVDDNIAVYNSTTGKLIKDGGSTIAEVLDTDNHTDGTTNKVFTAVEQSKLNGLGVDAVQTIYLGKHGNDSNDGLTFNDAKLTLLSAITAANALTPSITNPVSISCSDGGIYSETTVVIIPGYVTLDAPSATFEVSTVTNTFQMAAFSSINTYEVRQTVGGPAAIVGANDVGPKFIKSVKVSATGTSVALLNFAIATTGVMAIEILEINVDSGRAISDNSAGGRISGKAGCIIIKANNGTGISNFGTGDMHLFIDHILDDGALTGTTAIDLNSGTTDIFIPHIDSVTSWDVSSGAILNIFNCDSTGIETGTGTINLTRSGLIVTGTTAEFNTALTDGSFTTLEGTETLTNKTLTSPIISTISNTGTVTLPTATDTLVARATTDTLTNKRITTRVNTITSSATPTPAGDTTDEFTVTALAVGATFAAPTGTPTDGQVLLIRIKDNATAQTLAWNAIYRASTDLPLPTTTIISKTLYLQFVYNSTDSKFDLLGLLNNF